MDSSHASNDPAPAGYGASPGTPRPGRPELAGISSTAPGQVMLSSLTTLGLGGPPGSLVEVGDLAELRAALSGAERDGAPVLVIGGGSNVVIADEGFPGLVAQIAFKGVEVQAGDGHCLVSAGAGEDWASLVEYCVANKLSGLECLSGIPGLVGGAPVQNIGAYGQEVGRVVEKVVVWDREEARQKSMGANECRFAYRNSVFKRNDRYVVTRLVLRLERSSLSVPVRYPELACALGGQLGDRAPLEEVARAVLGLRRGKGMVLDPADPDTRSVGSFFTNPVIGQAEARRLASIAPGVPMFAERGGTKVPAAWLVEQAGFVRGTRRGRVGVSSKHALALTALPGASAAELIALAREIRSAVAERFETVLGPEPVLVGLYL